MNNIIREMVEDYKNMRKMSDREAWEYTKGVWASEAAKGWVSITYISHYLLMSNIWQYILVKLMN